MITDAKHRVVEALAEKLEAGATLLRRYDLRTRSSGRTLVLGGVRSGKSRHAELLMTKYRRVLYLAGDSSLHRNTPEWATYAPFHRGQKSVHWQTVEVENLTNALRTATTPVLIDCLGTWLSRLLSEIGAWEHREGWQQRVDEQLHELVHVWQTVRVPVVAVTNEVGSGISSTTHTGKVFHDVLGTLNTKIAAYSDSVQLVVAGRVIHL